MSSSISFGGLASGLDTTAIINALVSAEEIPILSVESNKAAQEAKLSLVSTFEGLVNDLKAKAESLADLAGLMSYTVTPSVENVANFSITGAPLAGSHSLTVNSLAAADRWSTAGISDDTSLLGMGTVSFDYDGTSYVVAVDPINSTIHDIADAINAQAAESVQASVVNTGTESSPSYELVLEGKDTGADFAITNLTSTVSGLGFNATALTEASDAQIVLNGLTINRSTNEFSDVIEGLSIEAVAADVGKTISFSIGVDSEGIEEKLNEFVEVYNEVMGFIGDQSTYNEDDGPGGALFGDNLLQSVQSKMYYGFVAADPAKVQADTEGYSALSLIGIKSTLDGTLEIDSTKLNEKLLANVEAFAGFFADSSDGSSVGAFSSLATELEFLTDSMGDDAAGDPIEGLFAVRKESLNTTISDMEDKIDDMNYRLDKYQESLVKKYSALEVLMAQLQAQESAAFNLSQLGNI